MKKIISLLILIAISLSTLASCSVLDDIADILDSYVDVGGQSKPNTHVGYRYTNFTVAEKAILNEYVGEVIPFVACNNYYFEGINTEEDFSNGVNYYTVGNSRSDFNSYVELLIGYGYELVDTYTDEYGDTWYTYAKGEIYLEVSYYFYSSASYIDVLAYHVDNDDNTEGGDNGNTEGDNGNTEGGNTDTGDNGNTESGDNGNTGGNDNTDTGDNGNTEGGTVTDTDGFRTVDFTKAKNVKDVTDQGYYLDGCPTTGSPAVLVIPVEFSDETALSKGYTTDALVKAWSGDADDTDYYSVHDYYYISSYGALDLDITVLDYWFRPAKTSSYYQNATMDYYGDDVMIGDQMIMDEALAQLSKTMDLSQFDSDNNGIIDAVVMINTLDIAEDDFHWAYRYWNIYTDSDEYYYEYDGVSANDYIWASYQFLFEAYDYNGNPYYTNTGLMNTTTYIHEFGHVLGADDYYDTSYSENMPLEGYDIMDDMTGDHNAYTKFNYGWLTTSRLVTTTSSTTLTLEDFSKNGDTIIIANNWSDDLGAYQEYYIVVYYTNNGLNSDGYGYFSRDGIIVYHVNSTLVKDVVDGETYYDIKNNNTDPSDSYGTEDNLIEFVKSSAGNFAYIEGDSLPSVKDDNGKTLGYTFTVDSLTDDTATITFTKR